MAFIKLLLNRPRFFRFILIVFLNLQTLVISGILPGVKHSSEDCGGFLTKSGKVIDLTGVTGDGWGEIKSKFEDEIITKVEVNSENGVIRFCSLSKKECKSFESSVDIDHDDVDSIVSATCGLKKGLGCNSSGCQNVKLEDGECARYYQEKSCNDCSFDHLSLPRKPGSNSPTEMVLKYQTVESIVVSPDCEATIGYNDTFIVSPLETGDIPHQYVLPEVTYAKTYLTCSCRAKNHS